LGPQQQYLQQHLFTSPSLGSSPAAAAPAPPSSSSAAGPFPSTPHSAAAPTTPFTAVAAELDVQRTQFREAVEGMRAMEKETAASVAELRALVHDMAATLSAAATSAHKAAADASAAAADSKNGTERTNLSMSLLVHDVAELKRELAAIGGGDLSLAINAGGGGGGVGRGTALSAASAASASAASASQDFPLSPIKASPIKDSRPASLLLASPSSPAGAGAGGSVATTAPAASSPVPAPAVPADAAAAADADTDASAILERITDAAWRAAASNSAETLSTATRTLLMVVRKIAEYPRERRYRRMPMGNENFRKTVAQLSGHEAILTALGFAPVDGAWRWSPFPHLSDGGAAAAADSSVAADDASAAAAAAAVHPLLSADFGGEATLTASVALLQRAAEILARVADAATPDAAAAPPAPAAAVAAAAPTSPASQRLASAGAGASASRSVVSGAASAVAPEAVVVTGPGRVGANVGAGGPPPKAPLAPASSSQDAVNALTAPAAVLARARARSRSGSLSAGVGPTAARPFAGRARGGSRSRASSRASSVDAGAGDDLGLAGIEDIVAQVDAAAAKAAKIRVAEAEAEAEADAAPAPAPASAPAAAAAASSPRLLTYADVVALVESGQADSLPGIQRFEERLSVLAEDDSSLRPLAPAPPKPWERAAGTAAAGEQQQPEDGGIAARLQLRSPTRLPGLSLAAAASAQQAMAGSPLRSLAGSAAAATVIAAAAAAAAAPKGAAYVSPSTPAPPAYPVGRY
jgi:hypothetical protein